MSYGWVCFFSPTLCSWGLFRLTSVPLAHCCRFDRVSHCTTLVIYHSPPPDGRSWQGQFFVVTNSASVSVLGHISRCTCVRFSREHSRKWNCWVGGCSHLQLYQLPNSSQKWLYQLYFSKIPPFFFFSHPCLHILRPSHIFLKSLPQTPVHPLHPRQLLQKLKKLGSGTACMRAREKLGHAQPRPLCHGSVGEGGRNSPASICE